LSESDRILKTALLLRIDFPACSNINILFRCLSRKALAAFTQEKSVIFDVKGILSLGAADGRL
jgi:hypothetical protein